MEENNMVEETNVIVDDNNNVEENIVAIEENNEPIVETNVENNNILETQEVEIKNENSFDVFDVNEVDKIPSRAVANPENVISGKTYRITVLTDRLVRLEYHPQGIFYDLESELVKYRDLPKVDFEKHEDGHYLNIKTKYFSISYQKERNFDGGKLMPMSNLKVELNGTDKSWYYNHPEVKNTQDYKGNFFSLDGNDNDMKSQKGLYSPDGFASIDDSKTLLYDINRKIYSRDGRGIDIYLFMYGKDYNLAIKDYFEITGYPALIPRYALGNWWSRDLDYSTEDIEKLVEDFEKNRIPLSILLLDKGWHKYRFNDSTEEVKSGFTFNNELISDPASLIKELHDKNIHIGLKIDPSDGIYPYDENYSKLASMFEVFDNKIIAFDPLNPVFLDALYQVMISPLTRLGVDFFWNDTDCTTMNYHEFGLYSQLLFERVNADDAQHEMILARNPMIATHRYPITYTGKSVVGWDTIKKICRINEQASNVGALWTSTDVSGNYGGVEEEELYVRSVQQATFGPILRFSAPRGRYYRKEPWRWNAKTLEIVSRYLRLRHRLIPCLYSEAYDYHKNGSLFMRPLYYDYPWVFDDETYRNEYYFGQMLVAPITKKKDMLMNRTEHRIYIPDGVWYDFMTGKKFPGNKEYKAFYRDEDYPIFVKRGGIIILNNDVDKLNFVGNPEKLEIHIFPGESNTFNLYEDKNEEEEKHLITQFDYNYLPNNYTLIIRNIDGVKGVAPDKRSYKVRFRNVKKAENVICYFNDSQIKTISYVEDSDFVVEINDVPTMGQITLNCKGKDIELDAMRFINDDIDNILLDLPINTVLKEQISAIMFSNLPIKRKRIEIRKLRKFNLGKEYIKLFLKLLAYIETI